MLQFIENLIRDDDQQLLSSIRLVHRISQILDTVDSKLRNWHFEESI